MKNTVEISHLDVVLGDNFKALENVSVTLEPGKITGFIGPSGAGKTTLIRTIVGRQRHDAGKVLVLGLPAGSAELRSKISYMTQELSVYSDLSVQENVRYFARMIGVSRKQVAEAARMALEQVDMTDKSAVLVSSLSGGQKQRVSLAIALLGEPELMVLDEPTVGLDPVLREQLWGLFQKLARSGKTIIISSHVMDEAERCDELLLIREGHVVASGTPHALCARTHTNNVGQAFLALAGGKK